MKKLTITEFKKSVFNTASTINHVSNFDVNNLKETRSDLVDANYELDSLKEAIFFKKEKFRGKLNDQKQQILDELCKELKNTLRDIQLKEISNTSVIVRRKKDLVEFERLENVLRYVNDIGESKPEVLEALFSSEDTEDWILLADIIYSELNFGSGDRSVFLNYSKKLEDKISDIFRNAISKNEINLCRSCQEILVALDKQEVLVDIFLLSRGLLTTEINVHPPLIENINLSIMKISSTTFDAFLQNILKLLEENSVYIQRIFGEPTDYMISKIFKTSISINLENFLNVGNPAIFLACLQSAYSSLNSFSESLKSIFPRISTIGSMFDTFTPFLYRALLKEAQLFDEILNMFLAGTKSLSTYVINGSKVEKSDDYVRIYQNMLVLVDSFLDRKKLFYTNENEVEIMMIFAKKLTLVIGKIISSDKDEIDMLDDLTKPYMLNRKVLGEKNHLFNIFNSKLEATIKETFNLMVDTSKKTIKDQILNMDFDDQKDTEKLILYLKNMSANTKRFGEKNLQIMLQKIVSVIFPALYAQILSKCSDEIKANNVLRLLDGLSGYFSLSMCSFAEPDILHLKLVCRLIVANRNDFENLLNKAKVSLNEREIHEIVKIRNQHKS